MFIYCGKSSHFVFGPWIEPGGECLGGFIATFAEQRVACNCQKCYGGNTAVYSPILLRQLWNLWITGRSIVLSSQSKSKRTLIIRELKPENGIKEIDYAERA